MVSHQLDTGGKMYTREKLPGTDEAPTTETVPMEAYNGSFTDLPLVEVDTEVENHAATLTLPCNTD